MKQNIGLNITFVIVSIALFFLLGLNGALLILTLTSQLLGLTDLFTTNPALALIVSFLLPPLIASTITYLLIKGIDKGFIKQTGLDINYKMIKITLIALILVFYIFNLSKGI